MDGTYSLNKRDAQLFIKRLRKHLEPKKIKYYLVGEYGDDDAFTHRPHYHAIIIGWCPDKSDLIWHYGKWESKTLSKIWEWGNNTVGSCTGKSIGYVCGYIEKKLFGFESKKYNYKTSPFSLMSQSIGLKALDKINPNNPYFTLNGKKIPIPRAYLKKLDENTVSKINAVYFKEKADLFHEHGGMMQTMAKMDKDCRRREKEITHKVNEKKQINSLKQRKRGTK